MRVLPLGLIGPLVLILGCEELPPASNGAPQAASTESVQPSSDDVVEPEEELEYEREAAEVGVGKKGRNYGGGVVSEPIRQMFRVEQRMTLLNVDHAMQLYKAEHGKLPSTHEEFMQKIIDANAIELPELPDGERYVYDPVQQQLMVERPKR